jgi:hypothetical protein
VCARAPAEGQRKPRLCAPWLVRLRAPDSFQIGVINGSRASSGRGCDDGAVAGDSIGCACARVDAMGGPSLSWRARRRRGRSDSGRRGGSLQRGQRKACRGLPRARRELVRSVGEGCQNSVSLRPRPGSTRAGVRRGGRGAGQRRRAVIERRRLGRFECESAVWAFAVEVLDVDAQDVFEVAAADD